MLRSLAIVAVVALMPLAPAAAVVAINAPAHAVPRPASARIPAPSVDAGLMGFTFGEVAAALAGLVVVGLALATGRQPHSVVA